MNETTKTMHVRIFVRPRKLTRSGKRVDGWQAGFTETDGVCSVDKSTAINAVRDIAKKYAFVVDERW